MKKKLIYTGCQLCHNFSFQFVIFSSASISHLVVVWNISAELSIQANNFRLPLKISPCHDKSYSNYI